MPFWPKLARHGRALPLNRKERYYTGTVLPMIVAGDDFMNLGLFLNVCGVDVEAFTFSGQTPLQFFTEYSFAESLFTDADRLRFPDAPTDNDTPDTVVVSEGWLLAVEAKMFHNPTAEALNHQLRRQTQPSLRRMTRLRPPASTSTVRSASTAERFTV